MDYTTKIVFTVEKADINYAIDHIKTKIKYSSLSKEEKEEAKQIINEYSYLLKVVKIKLSFFHDIEFFGRHFSFKGYIFTINPEVKEYTYGDKKVETLVLNERAQNELNKRIEIMKKCDEYCAKNNIEPPTRRK